MLPLHRIQHRQHHPRSPPAPAKQDACAWDDKRRQPVPARPLSPNTRSRNARYSLQPSLRATPLGDGLIPSSLRLGLLRKR